MIRARLVFQGEAVGQVARSLQPDNLPEMSVQHAEGWLSMEFCVEKMGTLLSTADDLLMNMKIAEEILSGDC
jgi:hypothetical protein